MFLSLYRAVILALIPFALMRLWWRGRRLKSYRHRWKERLALQYQGTHSPVLWLHAVSVGETIAALPLIEALLSQYPHETLLITSMTPTGSTQVQKINHPRIKHAYLPYDANFSIHRFLKYWQPRLVILMETEIWPNLVSHLAKKSIPVLVANARLSKRSCRRYSRALLLMQPAFDHIWVAAQTRPDARRFKKLGVKSTQVMVTGNLKYDMSIPDDLPSLSHHLKKHFADRFILTAASTHPKEEEILLKAFLSIKAKYPHVLLWLVPRHPERAQEIYKLAQSFDLTVLKRSDIKELCTQPDVVLGDTIGEMLIFYHMADLVFVGGSLIEHGGHNYLEPAFLKKAMVTGPSCFNFKDVHRRLTRHSAIITSSKEELADTMSTLIEAPKLRDTMGKSAHLVALSQQGATQKHLNFLKEQNWL